MTQPAIEEKAIMAYSFYVIIEQVKAWTKLE